MSFSSHPSQLFFTATDITIITSEGDGGEKEGRERGERERGKRDGEERGDIYIYIYI